MGSVTLPAVHPHVDKKLPSQNEVRLPRPRRWSQEHMLKRDDHRCTLHDPMASVVQNKRLVWVRCDGNSMERRLLAMIPLLYEDALLATLHLDEENDHDIPTGLAWGRVVEPLVFVPVK
jgi:hypothetical protein